MNILHIVPYFPPANRYGGTPEAVFELVRAQQALGHNVLVLTTDAGLAPEATRDPIEWQFQSHSVIRAIGTLEGAKILYVRNRLPRLAHRLKAFTPRFSHSQVLAHLPERIDAAHFHEINIYGYNHLARFLIKKGAAIFVSAHGSFRPPVHRGWRRLLHTLLDKSLHSVLLRRAHRFVVLNERERNQFLQARIAPERLTKIPLGQPILENSAEDLPFAFPDMPDVFTLLYLGRITPAKGILTLYHAFRSLWPEKTPLRLVICGPDEGGIDAVLKANRRLSIPIEFDAVQDKPGIYFIPSISRRHIRAFYQKGDITVCPSPYESFGLVPVESLLCGTPTVATSAYGCLEHLYLAREAMAVVPPLNPESLKEALQHFIQMGKRKIPELQGILPSWPEIAQQHVEMYRGS